MKSILPSASSFKFSITSASNINSHSSQESIQHVSPMTASREKQSAQWTDWELIICHIIMFGRGGTSINCDSLHIGLAVRVFANGPGDLGSIPGRVIPKTQKMGLDASLLNTQHYKVRIKGKVEQSREGVAPSPTPWCSSYRKGNLRVTLDYGRQLYFFTFTFDDRKKKHPRRESLVLYSKCRKE